MGISTPEASVGGLATTAPAPSSSPGCHDLPSKGPMLCLHKTAAAAASKALQTSRTSRALIAVRFHHLVLGLS